MKAKYNHWYKCQEGQMPEDFENCTEVRLVVQTSGGIETAIRYKNCREEHYAYIWNFFCDDEVLAWMLPEPYKEE